MKMTNTNQTDSQSAKAALNLDIKKRLCHFINSNVPSADVNSIDDIVLSYVVTILESASQESCFDVDGSPSKSLVDQEEAQSFMEMLMAYIPDFMCIDVEQVYNWLLELESDLVHKRREAAKPSTPELSMLIPTSVPTPPAQPAKPARNRNFSESTEEEDEHVVVFDCPEYEQQSQILQEMFPQSSLLEIKHCITIADGNVEAAAATLLVRRDNGQALAAAALPTPSARAPTDDVTVKFRIIERYSYLDNESDQKEHRPLAPKAEPKKMVRYRDGKIVSLKGERYTEVPKSGVEEENLKKPKKQSP